MITIKYQFDADTAYASIEINDEHAWRLIDIRYQKHEYGADADGRRGEMRFTPEWVKEETLGPDALLKRLPDADDLFTMWWDNYGEENDGE